MIKIGQIGIGHNHSNKLDAVKKFPELFEIVGYAEEDPDWIEKRGNHKSFVDVPRLSTQEILEKSDAILVETDVWNLTKTAQMCIDAGKHIHMDKPASGTLEEYKHLLDTAKEKNLVVQLGYMYRYNPAINQLMDMVTSGKLGQVSAIHTEMSIRHNDAYRTWLNHFKGGDMYIFGSHLIDLIIRILGEPKKVMSSICSSGENGVEAPDLTAALLEYDRAIGRVFTSSVEWDGWARRCLCVDGSLGTVEIKPLEDPCIMTFAPKHDGKKAGVMMAQQIPVPNVQNDYRYDIMMQKFYNYVTGIEENPYSYDYEYMLHKVILEAIGGI